MSPRRNSTSSSSPPSDFPVNARFAGGRFTIGGGVAIFHVASARVVVCYHPRDKYWFLPKGRRDVHETTGQGAEREGYEESGYRNRLLPIPQRHGQPQPRVPLDPRLSALSTEPVWLQLYPAASANNAQYLLHWYAAETLPPDVEAAQDAAEEEQAGASVFGTPYQYPPAFPRGLTLAERCAMEPEGYEPPRHEGTGVDDEEALYESYLLDVEEAREKLRGSTMEDVIAKGWEGIMMRLNAGT